MSKMMVYGDKSSSSMQKWIAKRVDWEKVSGSLYKHELRVPDLGVGRLICSFVGSFVCVLHKKNPSLTKFTF